MDRCNSNQAKTSLTLGSLFDGSGGFPLAGILSGIEPLWASEIDPFAIRVTTKRLPQVKHYGDVSSIHGGELPPVDIITFGSPCQDMSIAGKRSGLDGSRSSLFYEAIRIVKEMREKTNGTKPRFVVWENVPGAFSSNKGQDFKAVLEAVIGVKEANAEVPPPDKDGWPYADCYLGDGWSVAYRMLDAQYWGVPQRRARIFLVGDFGGECAPEILFKSEGVSGYTPQGSQPWKRTAYDSQVGTGTAGGADEGVNAIAMDGYNGSVSDKASALGENCGMSTGRNGIVLCDQGGNRMDVLYEQTATLRAEAHHPPVVLDETSAAGFCTEHSANSRSIGYEEELSPTLRAGTVPATVAKNVIPLEYHPTDSRIGIEKGDAIQTLTSRMGTGGNNVPLLLKIRAGCEGGGKGPLLQEDKSATLSCNNDQTLFQPVAFGICAMESNSMKSDNPHSGFYQANIARTLDLNGGNPTCNQGGIAVVAFSQNQREEIRELGDTAGAVQAQAGMHQQTFVVQNPIYALQGSMIGRADKNGPQGDGVNEGVSFTLDTADHHAIAYCMTTGSYTQVEQEKTPTLMARNYKDDPVVAKQETETVLVDMQTDYIVRRLIPMECARLQGFPDWWCSDLETENPTEEDLVFWREVFETHRRILGKSTKPKSDKQIIKWLKQPHSDSAEYRLWGNGVALPCCAFVLAGIAWVFHI